MDRTRWGALALLCVACGGRSMDGDGATGLDRCGEATSCGGDLGGSWTVESYCADANAAGILGVGSAPECDAAFERAIDNAVLSPIDARIAFDDATYQFTGTGTLSFRFTYTAACFEALSGVALNASRCEAVSQNFQADPEYDGSCTFSSGGCHCNVSSIVTFDETGPYETIDGEVLVDGASTGGPYCVEGNGASVEFVSPTQGTLRMQLRR